jgi:hypothetical protein
MLIANFGHFTAEKFFEIDDAIRDAGPPKVDFASGGDGSPPAAASAPAATPPAGTPPAAPPAAPPATPPA